MSPPGRPKGEYRNAQHEGTPLQRPGAPQSHQRWPQLPQACLLGPRRALLVALASAAVLAGCTTVYPTPLAPQLFPATVVAPGRDPAAVWLQVVPLGQVFRNPPLRHLQIQIELPIGLVLEAAGQRALAEVFEQATTHAAADVGGLHLQLTELTLDLHSELLYIIPLPYIGHRRVDLSMRLTFSVQALGPDGQLRWRQSYDSGRQLLVPKKPSLLVGEPVPQGLQRLAHELAMTQMRLAAQDLRAWGALEHRRERAL